MVKNLQKNLYFSKAEKAERLKSNRLNGLTKSNSSIAEHKAEYMKRLKRQKDEYLKKLKSKRAESFSGCTYA